MAQRMSNLFGRHKRRLAVIVRVMAVDPRPRKEDLDKPNADLVVYQVPEHSRAHELLVETFTAAGIEVVTIESPPPTPRAKKS